VTVANTLAEVCEKVGADWSEIVPALKLDRRIGAYAYIAPGLGMPVGILNAISPPSSGCPSAWHRSGLMAAWRRNSRYRRIGPCGSFTNGSMSRINEPVVAILGVNV